MKAEHVVSAASNDGDARRPESLQLLQPPTPNGHLAASSELEPNRAANAELSDMMQRSNIAANDDAQAVRASSAARHPRNARDAPLGACRILASSPLCVARCG